MKKNYLIPAIRIANSKLVTSVIECSGSSDTNPTPTPTPTQDENNATTDVGSKRFNYGRGDDDFWSTK